MSPYVCGSRDLRMVEGYVCVCVYSYNLAMLSFPNISNYQGWIRAIYRAHQNGFDDFIATIRRWFVCVIVLLVRTYTQRETYSPSVY